VAIGFTSQPAEHVQLITPSEWLAKLARYFYTKIDLETDRSISVCMSSSGDVLGELRGFSKVP
jgi:hypothetical protein